MAGIQDIARGAGVKTDVVSDVFEQIFQMIKKGERVRVIGFGTFERKTFPGRKLQTPAINEGEPFRFGDSYRLAFKQSQQAKRRLNKTKRKKAEAKSKDKKSKKSKGKKKGKKK